MNHKKHDNSSFKNCICHDNEKKMRVPLGYHDVGHPGNLTIMSYLLKTKTQIHNFRQPEYVYVVIIWTFYQVHCFHMPKKVVNENASFNHTTTKAYVF